MTHGDTGLEHLWIITNRVVLTDASAAYRIAVSSTRRFAHSMPKDRRGQKVKSNGASLGFEEKLWAAAEKLQRLGHEH